MWRWRRTRAAPFFSRKSSSSDGNGFRLMAGNDQMDQDAIAAQGEASLDSEDPAEAAKAAAANEISGTMALQWAAMVEDGSRDFGNSKNSGERVLSQEEIDNLLGFTVGDINLDDHSGIRAIIRSEERRVGKE